MAEQHDLGCFQLHKMQGAKLWIANCKSLMIQCLSYDLSSSSEGMNRLCIQYMHRCSLSTRVIHIVENLKNRLYLSAPTDWEFSIRLAALGGIIILVITILVSEMLVCHECFCCCGICLRVEIIQVTKKSEAKGQEYSYQTKHVLDLGHHKIYHQGQNQSHSEHL